MAALIARERELMAQMVTPGTWEKARERGVGFVAALDARVSAPIACRRMRRSHR